MDGLAVTRRRRTLYRATAAAAVVAVLGAASACSTGGGPARTASSASPTITVTAAGPVTAEINQFRDNYSKQIIEIQLTNTTDAALTVLGADLTTPLFTAPITWPARTGGIELPPGQTKSLPAPLPAPECASPATSPATAQGVPGAGPGGDPGSAVVSVRLAAGGGTEPAQAAATVPAADPFGVLARNNSEMCLTREATAVATIGLAPELEVAADGRTAVVRLLVAPRAGGGRPASGGAVTGELVIDKVEETTLLAEAPEAPWPHSLTVRAGGPPVELRLGIRPARCDPHAVAEDKVGTLLPLRVKVAGRDGVLKIAAGDTLRNRIYDFVTTECGRQ